MQKQHFDVIIIGGGLAGLCSAIHLSKFNISVLLIEKNSYPKHKVCGEYISNEVLPYLKFLGFNPFEYGAKRILKFELTTHNNKHIEAKLPLGGFGISRYQIDYQLYQLALSNGVVTKHDSVVDVMFKNEEFEIKTKSNSTFSSKVTIGAFGKRSNLDIKFKRSFITKQSPYLGVKVHVKGNFSENKVALHNFKGGYCGVSKVENNLINLCYITNYASFKKYKDIQTFQKEVVFKNTALKDIFEHSDAVFEKPLTISQISFKSKTLIENHMLMCGDAAGMIHPLCGNGMGMAISSAKLVSDVIVAFLNGQIKTRQKLENAYSSSWKKAFAFRLKIGHTIAYLFRQDWLAPKLLVLLRVVPFLVPKIIRMTHGKPITL